MKIHGLDLDNSPLISQDKALRYAQNIAIGEGNQSYINEDGFELKFDIFSKVKEHISNIANLTIIGTIPTNIGVVLFCVSYNIDLIVYIKTDTDEPTIQKILYSYNLNFDINRPIHGDYIYNYKEELIVTFTEGTDTDANETRVINLTTPYGGQYNNDSTILYKIVDISSLNIIPDVEYPKMTIDVEEGGNLRTGAYQIAISYKLQDSTYTNYSILSVPVIVCGNYGEDYAPNSEINRKIIVSFDKPNVSYNTYKLGIVHCNGTSQDCYETEDVSLKDDLNIYTISNLNNYNTIVLDDIFIKNISYIREKTLVNYNNRLIRGNVQTLDYNKTYNIEGTNYTLNEYLKYICENHIEISQSAITGGQLKEYLKTNSKPYFKDGEAYVLYAGFFDYKGDLINIYHIPNNNSTIPKISNNNNTGFLIGGIDMTNDIYIGYSSDLNKNTNFNKKFNNKEYYSLAFRYIMDDARGISMLPSSSFIILNYDKIPVIVNTLTNNENESKKIIFKYSIYYYDIRKTGNITYNIYKRDSEGNIESLYEKSHNTNINPNYVDYEFELELKANEVVDIINTVLYITQVTDNPLETTPFFKCQFSELPLSPYTNSIIAYNINAKLNINIPTELQNIIKSVVYFYIEHNTYNSRILSQALCVPDTDVVNFANNQEYTGQFKGTYALRFYPFEYLYNQISKLNANIQFKYNIGSADGKSTKDGITFNIIDGGGKLESTYIVKPLKSDYSSSTIDPELDNEKAIANGVKILDCDIQNLELLDNIIIEGDIPKTISLEYIANDNTSQQNIAGDSYYRTKDLTIKDYPNASIELNEDGSIKSSSYENFYIANIINPAENLYSNLDNQKLQIASPIIPITSIENTTLTGDTYLSYLTLRLTTPASSFRYGDSEFKEGDSNTTVYRWIFTFPIESKYNITARYSDNIIDKPYFLHEAILQKYKELLGTSYKVDNYINTSVGKGYNPVYNENGVEQFSYYKEIPGTSNHPYRIIRSLAQNPESIALNWRTFKTDDYKDIPFNRGEIISLKTDNKNLYIQQKYGLHLLQQRDQLNNNDSGDSYLGTSDLFNMEPKEIVYSPSGYIGCESYFDTNININGYIVIDVIHKKIFMISGDKPLEISNLKTKDFFNKFLSNKNGAKRIINYSENKNILYITQLNSDIEKTMSFSPLNKAWVSFHTYIPDLGFVNRNGLFWGKNSKLYSPILNRNKGLYIDNRIDDKGNPIPEPSIIQFILNENTIYNKLLKTIVWKDQVSYKGDDYIQHFFKETINHIMVHNFDQCSGELDVAFNDNPKEWWNGDTGTNKINLWRFNKLFDLVTNPENQFMIDDVTPDYTKLKWDVSTAKPLYKWYDVNRFICQFIYLTMWCNNTSIVKQVNGNTIEEYHEWELIDIHPEWQLDNRNDQAYNYQDNNQ